ncbi:hypothetical protein Z042_23170 [Chania multitudinisentens RB-25]|uniref:Uncharacterized protein n=1 Tax=Chania multitudinisentens RB-25 TaxID=1441930 RepID=W0LE98_9GAMM|nr:hypothetical protein Z042_23170 [Chania multitudinisentens RB-25]
MNLDLTGNETAEELEAMLERLGDVEISDMPPVPAAPGTTTTTAPAVVTTTVEQTKTGDKEASPTPGETVEQTTAPVTTTVEVDDKPLGILGKDGKHVIPYAVLEAARAESRRIAENSQQTVSELEQTKRQLQLLTQQVNQAGLTPAELPEKSQITPEQLAAIRRDFPDLAGVFETMAQKIEYLQQVAPSNQPVPAGQQDNPVAVALKATPDLDQWQTADPDRFELAVHIDDKLKNDPAWKDKPLTERFSEVVKRTKAAYGEKVEDSQPQPATTAQTAQPPAVQLTAEQLQKIADDKLAAAKAATAVPASPSDIGSTTVHQPTLLEQAVSADDQQLAAMFANMTEAQIDALLDQTI